MDGIVLHIMVFITIKGGQKMNLEFQVKQIKKCRTVHPERTDRDCQSCKYLVLCSTIDEKLKNEKYKKTKINKLLDILLLISFPVLQIFIGAGMLLYFYKAKNILLSILI